MMNDVSRNFPDEEPTYKKGGRTMKTKMKRLMKNQKGMTLIELLAVIVIIAIIALIAIPAIGNIINKSHDKAILSDASQVISGAKIAISDGACDAGSSSGTTDGTKTGEYTCTGDQLAPYVEGVKLSTSGSTTATVIKTDAGYTLTYSGFNGFKTDNFKSSKDSANGIGTDNTITDTKLAKLMGNK